MSSSHRECVRGRFGGAGLLAMNRLVLSILTFHRPLSVRLEATGSSHGPFLGRFWSSRVRFCRCLGYDGFCAFRLEDKWPGLWSLTMMKAL